MSQGTLLLTESEFSKFKKPRDEREVQFYLAKEIDANDVGKVRPVITTSNLITTHYLLTIMDWSGEGDYVVSFDHFQDSEYEQSTDLDIQVVEDEISETVDDLADQLNELDMSDEELVLMLDQVKQRVVENEYEAV